MNIDFRSRHNLILFGVGAVVIVAIAATTWYGIKKSDVYTDLFRSDAATGPLTCSIPREAPAGVSQRIRVLFPTGIADPDNVWMSSKSGAGRRVQEVVGKTLPAGTYKLTLESWDAHSQNGGGGQTREQYKLELRNSSNDVLVTTGASADIPDNRDYHTTALAGTITVPAGVAKIAPAHAAFVDNSTSNSLTAVCAAFDVIASETPTPTPTPTVTPTETPTPTVTPTESPTPTVTPTTTPTVTPTPAPTSTPTPTPPAAYPAINVNKTADPTSFPAGGGSVTYAYVVTNTGNVTLTDIALDDNTCGTVTLISGDANANDELEISEAWTYGCTITVTETTTNIAIVEGWYGDTEVTDSDDAIVAVGESAPLRLGIEKLGYNVTRQETDYHSRTDGVDASPNDVIQFLVTVRSDSTAQLHNVIVRDVVPVEMIYEAGSTEVDGITYPDGIATAGGLYLGDLDPNEIVQIIFRARARGPDSFASGTTVLINAAYVRADGVPEKEAQLPIYVTKTILIPVGDIQTGADVAAIGLLAGTVLTSLYYVGQSGLGFLRVRRAAATLGVLLFLLAGSVGLSSALENSTVTAIEIKSPARHGSDSYLALIGRDLRKMYNR